MTVEGTGVHGEVVEREVLEIAVDIARRAGQLTLQWFQSSSLTIERKRDGTPVTEADRAAEAFIRDELRRRFPHDSIIGEEFADHVGSTDRTWYVDPIDGTKSFSHGVPLYSNLLAMFDATGSAVGVINVPALDEVVYIVEVLHGPPGRLPASLRAGWPSRLLSTRSTAEAGFTAVLARTPAAGLSPAERWSWPYFRACSRRRRSRRR